ncbi:MAG: DUF4238 domain-containing protein [Alistipes shahii]
MDEVVFAPMELAKSSNVIHLSAVSTANNRQPIIYYRFLGKLANILADKYWEFYYTDTNQIYTFDYPITIEPHVKDAPNYYEGFGMYGAEISMPISKNIVLVIWDSQYFQEGLSNILCQ